MVTKYDPASLPTPFVMERGDTIELFSCSVSNPPDIGWVDTQQGDKVCCWSMERGSESGSAGGRGGYEWYVKMAGDPLLAQIQDPRDVRFYWPTDETIRRVKERNLERATSPAAAPSKAPTKAA